MCQISCTITFYFLINFSLLKYLTFFCIFLQFFLNPIFMIYKVLQTCLLTLLNILYCNNLYGRIQMSLAVDKIIHEKSSSVQDLMGRCLSLRRLFDCEVLERTESHGVPSRTASLNWTLCPRSSPWAAFITGLLSRVRLLQTQTFLRPLAVLHQELLNCKI